ncbi:MarR family winged helix-turn-helix transcriptional regulator [Streptomyces sp. NPDC007851]|uniref:MarR family winged helix-turn-helix transcriptional regulator n=1 Tax=Streptomyces sp. NPDC007851 TaxID=3155008 RepID=UPI0033CC7EBB
MASPAPVTGDGQAERRDTTVNSPALWASTKPACAAWRSFLRDVEGAAATYLAGRLGLTAGSVTTLLDRLRNAGCVTRSPHPAGGRRAGAPSEPVAGGVTSGGRRPVVRRPSAAR